MLVIFATVSVLILAILWYKFKSPNPSKGAPSLPPGPRGLPIIGYIPFLSPDSMHRQFANMANTYGPVFQLKLGSQMHVVISTPELAREVLRDKDETFNRRHRNVATNVITNGGQDIAFSDYNPNWRLLRKIFVREMLNTKNLEATTFFRTDEVKKAVKSVFPKIGTQVNIREVAFATETNVLTRTIWGTTSDKDVKNRNLAHEIDIVAEIIVKMLGRMNISDVFPILARFDLQGVARDMKKQGDKMDELFTRIIGDRTESNLKKPQDEAGHEEKKDFLQVLLNYRDDKDGRPLDMSQIKLLLLDIMIAGTETTATTVEWTMTRIMTNHNIMKKVQEELAEVVGLNNMVEEHHLPELKYLDATIKESLRLHPIVPLLIPRAPCKDCVVGGYTIPKGSTILVNVWSIHRDTRYWDDPTEFKPERFLTNKWDYKGNNLTYFPFGSGRRVCPGAPLAERMLMLIVGSLLHSFDWDLPKGEKHDLADVFSLTMKQRKPLIAIPSQRLSDVSLYM